MLNQIKKSRKDQKGFTIIEVLIVLAIAGLIMVVVFLAVPALQRNQRNQSRKTEANNIMSAVNEIQSNKGGTPIATGDLPTLKTDVKLSQYSSANISFPVNATTAPTKDQVFVFPAYTCSATDPTAAPTAVAGSRTSVVWYAVETGSGVTTQCIQS